MSERSLESLTRFTPYAGKLDRDELLFEAGRASTRPDRSWKAAASVLAVTQCLSLVLLLPATRPMSPVHTIGHANPPSSPSSIENAPITSSLIDGSWAIRNSPADLETVRQVSDNVRLMESPESLRAFLRPPDSLLN